MVFFFQFILPNLYYKQLFIRFVTLYAKRVFSLLDFEYSWVIALAFNTTSRVCCHNSKRGKTELYSAKTVFSIDTSSVADRRSNVPSPYGQIVIDCNHHKRKYFIWKYVLKRHLSHLRQFKIALVKQFDEYNELSPLS